MRSSPIRWSIVCGAALLFSSSALLARQGIVKARDGRTYEGEVTEKAGGVTVVVRGISTTLTTEQIDSIQYVGDIDEQYKAKLGQLPANAGAPAHVELARWLFDNHSYDLALKEVARAEQLDPKNTDAMTLEQTIQSQKRLERMRPGAAATPSGTGTGVASTPGGIPAVLNVANPPAGGHTAADRHYITLDDINTIRQVEWPRDDKTVRATVPAETRKKYIALAGEKAGEFNALPPAEQARAILGADAKDLRKSIRILTDPAPLAEFRRTIQPMILKGCGLAGCHGGPAGGKFFLYSPAENDQALYTNFYLLTRGGMNVEGAEHLLIDRTYPNNSLLAEMGLPPEISKVKHPVVGGVPIRAMFKSRDDANYKTLVDWMGKSLVLVPGPTGINFSLDVPAAPVKPK